MSVHVLIWQFLDSSYKFLIMSVPNVSRISERGGKSRFLQRWLKVQVVRVVRYICFYLYLVDMKRLAVLNLIQLVTTRK